MKKNKFAYLLLLGLVLLSAGCVSEQEYKKLEAENTALKQEIRKIEQALPVIEEVKAENQKLKEQIEAAKKELAQYKK